MHKLCLLSHSLALCSNPTASAFHSPHQHFSWASPQRTYQLHGHCAERSLSPWQTLLRPECCGPQATSAMHISVDPFGLLLQHECLHAVEDFLSLPLTCMQRKPPYPSRMEATFRQILSPHTANYQQSNSHRTSSEAESWQDSAKNLSVKVRTVAPQWGPRLLEGQVWASASGQGRRAC